MEPIKQQLVNIISTYNKGLAVSYPAIDRKMMMHYPEVVKAGKLGLILDELVAEHLIEQVGPSSYQVQAQTLVPLSI